MKLHEPLPAQRRRCFSDLPLYTEDPSQAEPLSFHIEPYRRFGALYRTRYLKSSALVMSGPDANEFIWSQSELWSYSRAMNIFREQFDDTYLLQLDGSRHQKKRRRFIQGFKHADLIRHVPAISRVLAQELAAIPAGRHPDLRQLCNRLTVSMACQALLQLPLPRDLERKIVALEHDLLQGEAAGVLRHLWYRRPSYQRSRREVFASIQQMLDTRKQHPPRDDDILSLILKAHPADEPPITRQELLYDVFLLLEASSETTAHLLLWTLMYIYDHPTWLVALREELRLWAPERFTNMNDWPRLKATILEVERLRPPVPFFIKFPSRDFEYQGVQIPRHTTIFHAAAVPHFLPEIFEDPLSFKPERFIGEDNHLARVLVTFGAGKHSCLGMLLAYIEIVVAVASIVTKYDLVFDRRPSFRCEMQDVITPIEPALPVQFVSFG